MPRRIYGSPEFPSSSNCPASCSGNRARLLSGTPPDLEALFVYFDSVGIPRDTNQANGWDYDPITNQVTFYGPACDALRSGSVTDLVIVYGCPIDIG